VGAATAAEAELRTVCAETIGAIVPSADISRISTVSARALFETQPPREKRRAA